MTYPLNLWTGHTRGRRRRQHLEKKMLGFFSFKFCFQSTLLCMFAGEGSNIVGDAFER